MAAEALDNLTIVFSTPATFKFTRPSNVPNFSVDRAQEVHLSNLHHHLEQSLRLSYQQSLSLLPIAVCISTSSLQCVKLPLVTDHVWRNLVDQYPYDSVKVILETRPSINLAAPTCSSLLRKELKLLDMTYYLPQTLERKNLVTLSEDILHRDVYIKPKLRRGVWMHLLGVFHPALKTKEQRESYIHNLRRVYDTLKARVGNQETWPQQVRHLRESVHRDAVRTDPSLEFLALPENVQKLVDIITIYTLEHSEIRYTQGMTDLLSPLLYVMGREDDAYICFAAMFQRIKLNFTEWCEGTLNKLERLKHLCEVLDPELYAHLASQQLEDPFVLFFGMVLIECRREFNFQDGLHLFEVLWAAALQRNAPTLREVSRANWASFMTSDSPEIILQTFGEVDSSPYSTQPLEDSLEMVMSPNNGSNSGSHHCGSTNAQAIPRPDPRSKALQQDNDNSTHYSTPVTPYTNQDSFLSCSPQVQLKRSLSLPDNSSFVILDSSLQSCDARSDGNLCRSNDENEMLDSVTDLEPSKLYHVSQNTEMADMSSVSSNGNRNSSGEDGTGSYEPHPPSCILQPADPSLQPIELLPSLEMSGEHNEGAMLDSLELDGEVVHRMRPNRDGVGRSQTLPRGGGSRNVSRGNRRDQSLHQNRTLPRSSGSTLPPAAFLHHLSRPSLSSPYVSSIRALDPHVSYPNTNLDPFQDEFDSQSPPQQQGSPLRQDSPSPCSLSASNSSINESNYLSPSPLIAQVSSHSLQDSARSSRAHSIEASLEVSHMLSGLMSGDHAHPNVNRETSLRIKMADAFSLFVCLAILVKNRHEIITNRMDFVSLSVLLNEQAESQSLPTILKIARQLHSVYYKYQALCLLDEPTYKDGRMFETWLDDPSVLLTTMNN